MRCDRVTCCMLLVNRLIETRFKTERSNDANLVIDLMIINDS